ncbi:type VII secretion protein EccB [Corynebacterium pseudopelargi]|uniref:ESX-1 secretion system protein eccB1 n=1 Tax=Corynebacterium pseudopelargi TaxID=2080757 RepID=A0A3G6IWM2_9CORY|nr:type VII secretion protein EccB [Corynebacterium pseudopelargi]AZA09953.1 ESX-1 secretion system protein eccB1 [Corynebacterium pseudopelargi]
MAQPPMRPTTKAQVSGHKFLSRRLELGVALGDERMLHDPLGKRRKAVAAGLAISILLCVGSAALAWLKPEPDPGDAPILKAKSGQLLVREEEVLHPVANLASARLLVGEPANPIKAGDQILKNTPIAAPVGIIDAPGILSESPIEQPSWSLCTTQGANTPTEGIPRIPGEVQDVVLGQETVPRMAKSKGILAAVGSDEWIISHNQRLLLPPADTPEGRVIRRHMDIDHATARWRPPEDVLNAITEAPPVPQWQGDILQAEDQAWLSLPQGIVALTPLQRDILLDLGNNLKTLGRTELTQRADAQRSIDLPESTVEWINPAAQPVCIQTRWEQDGFTHHVGVLNASSEQLLHHAVALAGTSVATHAHTFGTSIGVRTINGTHVIGESGLRHRISDAHYPALGLAQPVMIPWVLLRLLPEGSELSASAAGRSFIGSAQQDQPTPAASSSAAAADSDSATPSPTPQEQAEEEQQQEEQAAQEEAAQP